VRLLWFDVEQDGDERVRCLGKGGSVGSGFSYGSGRCSPGLHSVYSRRWSCAWVTARSPSALARVPEPATHRPLESSAFRHKQGWL